MKKKIIIVIFSAIILIGGIIGISLYFGLRDTKTELSISFYDNKTVLSLGKFEYKIKTRIGNPMESGNIYYFESEDDCKSCFEEIKKSEFLILDKGDYAVYNKDGYYFFSRLFISTKQSVIILENFFTRCVDYGFYPFFLVHDGFLIQSLLTPIMEGEEPIGYTCSIPWQSFITDGGIHEQFKIKDNPLEISSKEEVLDFYSKVNPEYWQYDEEDKVLYLKHCNVIGFSSSEEDRVSKNYTMEMNFMGDGITLKVYYDTYFE